MSTKNNSGIPAGVSYVGPQTIRGKTLMLFTEEVVSGSTFGLLPEEATWSNILAAAIQKRSRATAHNPEAFSE